LFDGTLTGSGLLTKSGSGKLILNASDNEADTVNVGGGSLIVGGTDNGAQLTATGGVSVQNGALLGGHGTIISDVTIQSGGILSPGNSPGKITIETLNFESGAVFEVEVDPNQPYANPGNPGMSDRVIVTGTATLNEGTIVSHISKDSPSGDYLTPGKEWLILSAAKFEGEFDENKAISDLAFLMPRLRYADEKSGDDIDDTLYLYFTRKRLGDLIIDAVPEGPLFDEIMSVTESDRQRVLNELSGEAHATLKGTLLRQDDTFMRRLIRHVGARSVQRSAASGTGDNLWISVNQTYQIADGNGNAARAKFDGTEIAFGHDAEFADGWLGGLAFRLDNGRLDIDRRRSEADITSGSAALYGGREIPFDSGTLRVLLSGALTRHEVDSKRHVRIGPNDQKLEASYAGNTFTGAFETAYRLSPTEKFAVEPYASVAWHSLHLEDFKEKGGTAALKKKGETWNRATSTLGMRLSTSPQAHVTFDADIGWQHFYGSATPKSAFAFRGGSDRFTTRGADVNKDAAILGLSVSVKLAKDTKISLQYDGELGSQGQSHGGQVVFEMKW
jgi:outer membrane autotransporter protein